MARLELRCVQGKEQREAVVEELRKPAYKDLVTDVAVKDYFTVSCTLPTINELSLVENDHRILRYILATLVFYDVEIIIRFKRASTYISSAELEISFELFLDGQAESIKGLVKDWDSLFP